MENELEKQHATLVAAAAKYTNKVSPLLLACGLIQEGSNLNNVLAEHCQRLKDKIDELEKRLTVNKDGPPV